MCKRELPKYGYHENMNKAGITVSSEIEEFFISIVDTFRIR
jgi:hypothetical protein